MKSCLLVLLTVFFMIPQSRANLIEDIIDLYGAYGTMGLSLRVREMNEAELAAELDRRLASKLLEITNATKKKRSEIIKGQISALISAKFNKEQILLTINESISFVQDLDLGYKNYISNRAESVAQVESLIQSLNLQVENLMTWSELFSEVSSSLKDNGESQDLQIPLIAANYQRLADQFGLSKEQLMQISIHLGDQEQLKSLLSDLGIMIMTFEVAQTQLETQISIYEMKMQSLEKALEELK